MQNSPTGSVQVNELLTLIEDYSSRKKPGSLCLERLQIRLDSLAQLNSDFQERAEQLGPEFRRSHQLEIDELNGCFTTHEQILHEIHDCITADRREECSTLCARLAEGTNAVLESMKNYSRIYWHWGDSEFPLANLLTRVLDALRRSQISFPAATTMIAEAVDYFDLAEEQLQKTQSAASADEWADKSAAVVQAKQSLVSIEADLNAGKIFADSQISAVESALARIHRSDEAIYQKTYLSGPTAMAEVNLLINTALGVLAGSVQPDVAKSVWSWYRKQNQAVEEEFDDIASDHTDSRQVQDVLPRTRLALDLLYDGVEDLAEALNPVNPSEVHRAISCIEAAVSRLDDSVKAFEAIADREGKTLCPKCSHPNFAERRLCVNCGAILPTLADPDSWSSSTFTLGENEVLEDEPVSQNLADLLIVCGQFYDGLVDAQAFCVAVEKSRSALRETRQAVSSTTFEDLTDSLQLEAGSNESETLNSEVDDLARRLWDESHFLLNESITEWEEGLDLMLVYSETREFKTLERGIAKAWAGSKKMLHVYLMADEAEKSASSPIQHEEPSCDEN